MTHSKIVWLVCGDCGAPGYGEDSIEDGEEGEVGDMDCEKREVPSPSKIAEAFCKFGATCGRM